MNTDIRLVISREELAGIVALTVVNRLKSILPMSSSTALDLESQLMEAIEPQILRSVTVHLVDGELRE